MGINIIKTVFLNPKIFVSDDLPAIKGFSAAAMLPSCGSDPSPLFLPQIIEWLCDNVNTFSCFDQIQEFILGQFQQKDRGPPDTSHLPLPLLHPLLSALSPLKNLVTFENLETSRQQPNNIFSRLAAA